MLFPIMPGEQEIAQEKEALIAAVSKSIFAPKFSASLSLDATWLKFPGKCADVDGEGLMKHINRARFGLARKRAYRVLNNPRNVGTQQHDKANRCRSGKLARTSVDETYEDLSHKKPYPCRNSNC